MQTQFYKSIAAGLTAVLLLLAMTRCKREDLQHVKVTTLQPKEVGGQYVVVEGEVDSEGTQIEKRGICFGVNPKPNISDLLKFSPSENNRFEVTLDSLLIGTTYYYKAVVFSNNIPYYGDIVMVETTSLPSISTHEISNINDTCATTGGDISFDGGAEITARGVVWSTLQNPTIETNNGITSNGTGTGSFTSKLTNLQPVTTYYVRAYATNNAGTSYGDQHYFTTSVSPPIVTTNPVSNITGTGATTGGNVTADGGATVTSRGVCYATTENPTTANSTMVGGNGTGSFLLNLTNLQPGTVYYIRAYATNSAGTSYGEQHTFTTWAEPPAITTTAISNITANSAITGGNVTANGGANVTARGVVWGTFQNPTFEINNGNTSNGIGMGSFTSNLTNLQPGTTYFVRAYATNSAGTSYGEQRTFTTTAIAPTIITTAISNITAIGATAGGNVTASGGATVTTRGVCYATTQNPTTASSIVATGSGTGSFTSNLTNLQPVTTYYVRAYASNSAGTSYGNQHSFTTTIAPPTVTTSVVSGITDTSATTGGNVVADGGAVITVRGICYSTSPDPTTSNNTLAAGNGTGSFTSNLTNLQPATTYYVRAFATNNAGTSYGQQRTFTTTGTAIVEVFNPATGKTWMDRNLGATRAAASSTDPLAYGDLYQWGRGIDGHQIRTSGTTGTLSNSDNPGHDNFVVATSNPYDWRNPQNANLWQGADGTNNPCPTGFRLPTEAEWEAERATWSSNNSAGAFASPLKLPVAGSRNGSNGSLSNLGSLGYYWSSTVEGASSRYFHFSSSVASLYSYYRAYGYSVRCIKDN